MPVPGSSDGTGWATEIPIVSDQHLLVVLLPMLFGFLCVGFVCTTRHSVAGCTAVKSRIDKHNVDRMAAYSRFVGMFCHSPRRRNTKRMNDRQLLATIFVVALKPAGNLLMLVPPRASIPFLSATWRALAIGK